MAKGLLGPPVPDEAPTALPAAAASLELGLYAAPGLPLCRLLPVAPATFSELVVGVTPLLLLLCSALLLGEPCSADDELLRPWFFPAAPPTAT